MKMAFRGIFTVIFAIGLLWLVWTWGFCRFYVGPNQMAIVTAKSGEALPPGQILAKPGEKGIREAVLGEGRHFLNPYFFEHEIREIVLIPAGKIGIVTSKVGVDLPEGEFLANPGQKGIWRKVLGPGKYRMNPAGYRIDVMDAVSIPIGYDGVLTSLSGKQALEGAFAGAGEKGVWQDVLQPGLYYVNPREFSVTILEIGVNQVSLLGRLGSAVLTKSQMTSQNRAMQELEKNILTEQRERRADYFSDSKVVSPASATRTKKPNGPANAKETSDTSSSVGFILSQFVSFPSRDGFEISLDMTVEFELLPSQIAWIYKYYGDLPAAVEKIIMPTILSVSRLKGSAYGARDFIVGEGREKFQRDLTETMAEALSEKNINIYSALIRHVSVPMQILDPIQQASIAQEQDLTNKEKQNTAKKQAELNTEISLIEQRSQQVLQETEKLKAEIGADQEKQVAETKATTVKLVAQIEKGTAGIRADQTRVMGKARADAWKLIEGETAKGFKLKVGAFGDPEAYGLWTMANNLNDDLDIRIIHAGEGTFWTDLHAAQLGDLVPAAIDQKMTKKIKK